MRRPRSQAIGGVVAIALVAVIAVVPAPAQTVTRAEHTVGWYKAHVAQREAVLRRCENDRSFDANGDCRNATAAAASTWGQGSQPDINVQKNGDSFDDSVAAFRADGFRRGMALGLCSTNRPPPAQVCANARAAQAQAR